VEAGALADRTNCRNDAFDFVALHRREQRQAYQALPLRRRLWKVAWLPSKRMFVIRVQVQRPPVHRTGDPFFTQRTQEGVAVDRK